MDVETFGEEKEGWVIVEVLLCFRRSEKIGDGERMKVIPDEIGLTGL